MLEQSAVSGNPNSEITQDPLDGEDIEYLEESASAAVEQDVVKDEPDSFNLEMIQESLDTSDCVIVAEYEVEYDTN